MFVDTVDTPVMVMKSRLLKLWGLLVSIIYWSLILEGITSASVILTVSVTIDSTDFPFNRETLAAAPTPFVNLLLKFKVSPTL